MVGVRGARNLSRIGAKRRAFGYFLSGIPYAPPFGDALAGQAKVVEGDRLSVRVVDTNAGATPASVMGHLPFSLSARAGVRRVP